MKINKRPALHALVFVCILVAAPNALAQQRKPEGGITLSSNKPIQIDSARLEIFDKKHKADFSGNVVVVQGDTMVKTANMTVFYKGNGGSITSGTAKIDHIDMAGGVLLISKTQRATGDVAHFNMNTQKMVLEGKPVVVTEGKNIFTGCRLTLLMREGRSKIDSCGRRVRIQLDPKSAK